MNNQAQLFLFHFETTSHFEWAARQESHPLDLPEANYLISGEETSALCRRGESPSFQEKVLQSLGCLSLVHASNELDNSCLSYLSGYELGVYNSYKHLSRKRNYLLGRYCAKEAIRSLVGPVSASSFSIIKGAFQQPLIRGLTQNGLSVSLSHSHKSAAALAYSDFYSCGIDIEKIGTSSENALHSIITQTEQGLLSQLPLHHEEQLTLLWSAKESLAKALKTGLTFPLSFLEISSITSNKKYYNIQYRYFPQYSAINFISNEMMISIAKPKMTATYELEQSICSQSI